MSGMRVTQTWQRCGACFEDHLVEQATAYPYQSEPTPDHLGPGTRFREACGYVICEACAQEVVAVVASISARQYRSGDHARRDRDGLTEGDERLRRRAVGVPHERVALLDEEYPDGD